MKNQLGYVPTLKAELTNIEGLGLVSYIQNWVNDNIQENFDVIDEFGLPYTSNDNGAELTNTNYNGELESYEGLRVVSFSLTENHTPIMFMKDNKENEFYFGI